MQVQLAEWQLLFDYCAQGEEPLSEVRAAVLEAFEHLLRSGLIPTPATRPRRSPGRDRHRRASAAPTSISGSDSSPSPCPTSWATNPPAASRSSGAGLERDWRGEKLAPGDRVTWASSIACGECFYCRVKRQPTRCLTRKAYGISYCAADAPHLRGGYAEKILLRAGTAIFRIPDAVPSEALIGAGCALTTRIHASERAPLEWGDSVVVQGTGPVGLAAIAVERVAGAGNIVAIGGPKHRLELARDFGADVVIDIAEMPAVEARRDAVLDAVGPYGADQVIECVGHPAAVNEGILLCRDGGQFVVLGQYADAGNISFNPHTITRKQLRVIGSWGFEPRHVDRASGCSSATPRLREKFARGITHRFPLDQADDALQNARCSPEARR